MDKVYFEAMFGRRGGTNRVSIASGTASMQVPEGTAAVLPLSTDEGLGEVYVALSKEGRPLKAVRVRQMGPDVWTEPVDIRDVEGRRLWAPVGVHTDRITYGHIRVGEPLTDFTIDNAWRARG